MRNASSLRLTLATIAAVVASVATASSAAAVEAPPGWRPFAPDSLWNLPLRDDAPLSPRSAAYTTWMASLVGVQGAWMNTTGCGMPQYWAAPGAPTVAVELDHPSYMDPVLIRAWSAVPIPDEAVVANCSDRNFSVAQVQPDGSVRSWEFWSATKRSDGTWIAKWGGATQDVTRDRGIASRLAWKDLTAPVWSGQTSNAWWNVTASSIAHDAGVIRQSELVAGRVDHALAMALPAIAAGRFLWPAQRTDGSSTESDALPEGARLRLDPSFDVEALRATPLVKMLARAAQNYGIVIRDGAGGVSVFVGEEPRRGSPDAAVGLLNGVSRASALRAFPWSALQVLDAPECTANPCLASGTATISVDDPPTTGRPVVLDTSNSQLDQPRARVEWDLDDDAVYERDAGTAVTTSWTPLIAGRQDIGVRITTRDGTVTTASRSVVIDAPALASAPQNVTVTAPRPGSAQTVPVATPVIDAARPLEAAPAPDVTSGSDRRETPAASGSVAESSATISLLAPGRGPTGDATRPKVSPAAATSLRLRTTITRRGRIVSIRVRNPTSATMRVRLALHVGTRRLERSALVTLPRRQTRMVRVTLSRRSLSTLRAAGHRAKLILTVAAQGSA